MLESIDGRAAETKREIYFEIEGKAISGFDGCNRFAGQLDALDRLQATQRYCPPEVLQVRLADAASQLETLKREGDTVELVLADGGGTARFRRVDAP